MGNTTKIQNLPFATDEECEQFRARLIRAGKIIPARRAFTATAAKTPIMDGNSLPPPKRRNAADIPEEGVYKVRRIKSDEEYERRKHNYLIMLQSILKSRIELGLEFGEQHEDSEESDGQI